MQNNEDDEVTMSIDEFGNKLWKNKAGEYHRLDGPALEIANGNKQWRVSDKLHRLGGPAIEWSDGNNDWYFNGKRHRLDGPAIERADGRKEWWVNGKRHRIGGPATLGLNGYKVWVYKGIRCKSKQTYFNKLNKKEKELCLLSPEFFDAE